MFSDTDCFGVNSARRPGGVKHFNYKEINWKHQMCIASANNKDFLFLEAMRDANLIQIIDVPTRDDETTLPQHSTFWSPTTMR